MKSISIALGIGVVLIGGAIMLSRGNTATPVTGTPSEVPENNVAIVDGKQIITLSAKGGYEPRTSVAKAGIPTVIRFDTRGTFDCSASVRIPSMNISRMLPQTGSTDIDIGTPQAGPLQGTCGMGMYPFEVTFQ